MRFEGASVLLWSSLALLGITGGIVAVLGWSEESIRQVIRTTGRTTLVFFSLAFTASALHRLRPAAATRWVLRNRRQLGLSAAASHTIHAAALWALLRFYPDSFWNGRSVGSLFVVGLVYVFLYAMAGTSFDGAVRWMGRRRWTALHRVGGWALWTVFAVVYLPAPFRAPQLAPFAALVLAVAGLRLAVRLRERRVLVAAR